jgi:ribulose-5-phosphate 4-epimerase/fuculose-1-phosphate aldolase
MMRAVLDRLEQSGMACCRDVHLAVVDDDVMWSHPPESQSAMDAAVRSLHSGAFIVGMPEEPWRSIIAHLAHDALRNGAAFITPRDSETRTFLHRIPCVPSLDPHILQGALQRSRVVISARGEIAAHGAFTAFEAAVNYSSVCFAACVRFITNCLDASVRQHLRADMAPALASILAHFKQLPQAPAEPRGPFQNETEVLRAICHAGRTVVGHRLVDSAFGNISFLHDDVLYISQTGAPLDDLESQVDACFLDNSQSNALTASSELPAHLAVVRRTGFNGVLHGHPLMTVAMSLHCDRPDCPDAEHCHTHCRQSRIIAGVPVVPGEVGAGAFGLCHTVPAALENHNAVIVLGHGVFAGARQDFQEATRCLFEIENACLDEFVKRVSRWAE